MEDFRNSQADEAFGFVLEYVKLHGTTGYTSIGKLIRRAGYFTVHNANEPIPAHEWSKEIRGEPIPAPPIPEATQQTLIRLSGNVKSGLEHVKMTPEDKIAYLRSEWRKVYRGVA